MDARAAAARWCATWRDAWPAADADRIVALYAPHATFSTQPFREPFRGPDGVREYVTRVLSEEEDQRVWMSEPIVEGDRASISWWASLREEGADATLAGTSTLRFDPDGLVVEQWDTWNVLDARSEPPTTWSPFADRRGRAG